MLLKFTLVIGVLLLAKEATALNCYTCVGVDSDQCDKIRVETPCLSGFENCYKFVGSVGKNCKDFFYLFLNYVGFF